MHPSTSDDTCSPNHRHANERGEVASWLILGAALALIASSLGGIIGPQIEALASKVGGIAASIADPSPGDPGPVDPGPVDPSPGDPGPVDPGLVDPDPGAVAPSAEAQEALDDVSDIIDAGDDDKINEDELDDIDDLLEGLTDEELAYLFANLSDEQLVRLLHEIHREGWIPPWAGWNDNQREAFFDRLKTLPMEERIRVIDALAAAGNVDTQDYLDLLVELSIVEDGGSGVDFPSATESDDLIREYIDEDYLDDPIANGSQAEGHLAIVDDENFELAWKANNPSDPDRWMNLNGFVDSEGRQWVRASQANAGTPVHEAIHNYADDALNARANQFNEGVTEYFTKQVVANTDDPATPENEAQDTLDDRANIYSANEQFVADLVAVVGEDVVAGAYFDGDIDSLEAAYIEATNRTSEDFNDMLDLVDRRPTAADGSRSPIPNEDWDAATDLLDVIPEEGSP